MRIVINYKSSWRNSFLEGDETIIGKKREFKTSSKSKAPIDIRYITKNTVLGVLCRLIGDSKKLFQSKAEDNFYFKNINFTFKDVIESSTIWNEQVMLINKKADRPSPNEAIGVITDDEPLFFSEYAPTLWSILNLDFVKALDFILHPSFCKSNFDTSPTLILNKILYDICARDNYFPFKTLIKIEQSEIDKEVSKEKPNLKKIQQLESNIERLSEQSIQEHAVLLDTKIEKVLKKLEQKYPGTKYVETNGSIKQIRIYSAALHAMLEVLKYYGVDISCFLGDRGGLKGFSKRGFNGKRDFLNSLMGGKNKTTRTPYNLTKANGQLEINLDIDFEKAKELKTMIDNAGVSSFYLGKKGLAYVSDISLR